MFSDSGFSEYLIVNQLIPVMMRFYPDFREEEFAERCEKFQIPRNKQLRAFSTGMKAKLNVLLALSHGSRLLLLDEPTAVLTPQETERLFEILRKMKEKGCAIIIITHKLQEVLELSDRVTILR